MKSIKTFGLALATALTAIALVSVGSTSGTALCEDEGKEGGCGSPYGEGTAFVASSSSIAFKTNLGTVNCTSSSMEGEIPGEPTKAEEALEVRIAVLSFGGCTLGKGACTVSSIKTPFDGSVMWTEADDGTLTLESGEKGTPGVSLKCGEAISCTGTGEPILGVNGGKAGAATIVASEEKLTPGEGIVCPKELSWTGTYTFTVPAEGQVFVQPVAMPVRLCKVDVAPLCNPGTTYPINTPLEAKLEAGTADFTLKINNGPPLTTSCTSSTLTGKTTSYDTWPLKAEISGLTFTGCGGICSVSALLLSYAAEIEATAAGHGSGTITMRSGGSGPPRIKVDCGINYKCTYEVKSNKLLTTVPGGATAPAKLSVNALLDEKTAGETEAKCGPSLTWTGSYKFTKPEDGGVPKMWIVRNGIST